MEEDLKTRQTSVSAARQNLDEMRALLSRQRARRESLEEILSHRAYTTESVKRLFTAIGDTAPGPGTDRLVFSGRPCWT